MHKENSEMIQIRWHGRGGQGAITAAKVVAEAAFKSGYAGVAMAPTFGTERRGAPVCTSLKIAKGKIYDLSPIVTPDIVVVLDHLILKEVDVTAGLKPGGLLVINSPHPIEKHKLPNYCVAVANVTKLGVEAGLRKGVVNSGIIGVLSKASRLVNIDLLADCITKEFYSRRPEENARSARLAFESTQIQEMTKGGTDA
jgi:2-oxoacid:acceptor oxidoreductase gamma subunit (pyruvate/2-ketoisovalerate family)